MIYSQGYVAAAVTGDFGVVRHEDNRASLGVELLEEYQYFEAGAGVEVPRRFVREDDGRIVDQRPRDRHALHLPARHLVALMQHAVAETDVAERLFGPFPSLCGRVGRVVHQRQLDVLQRRSFGQQVIVLEDETDLAVAQRGTKPT